ncbi:glycosyltransferase [Haloferax prahovense]|uniref:glycosyltransferase n=1 Tax=Haloferax prahovense TaxID=381852 RepID=UPI0006787FC1|nr:glycosyltransferase [Haloferax prahovense]
MRARLRRLLVATFGLLSLTGVPYLVYLALLRVVDTSGSPARKSPDEPTVSIVLPTYNEASIIEAKLEDILALDYPMEKVEVVVADASDDDTPAVVRDFFAGRDAPELTLLHDDERRGVAPALNEAFAAASNELVFRTDADSKLAPDVLRQAAGNLSDPTIGAVTGQQSEVLGDSEVESDYRGILTKIQGLESHLDSTFIFHGPCFAFRAEDFVPIAPDSLADDTELALRIRRAGKRVVMDPAMAFTESGVSKFSKRRQRKDRRAMGLLKLLVQNRDMLGRYGFYGTVVLPFNWWFMVVSPWLLAATVVLATASGVLLAGPLGLAVPGAVAAFAWAGQSERLGPLQPLYAVFDSQVSLLVAAVELLRDEGDGTWELDRESREYFE